MNEDSGLFSILPIFSGAAIMAALALCARQSLRVARLVPGRLAGPPGGRCALPRRAR